MPSKALPRSGQSHHASLHYLSPSLTRSSLPFRRLTLSEPTSEITLHTASPLVLLGAVVVPSADSDRRLAAVEVRRDAERELSTIVFGGEVGAGEATLGVRWRGVLQEETMLGKSKLVS